jgi:hypothetical protein
MTVTTSANGQARRTLAEQIDRLDGILDGLADGLNEAVAGAVREATARAVQDAVRRALVEVLTNPDVLALLGTAARAQAPDGFPTDGPAAQRRPGVRAGLGAVGGWVRRQAQAVLGAGGRAAAAGRRAAAAGRRAAGRAAAGLVPVWQLRRPLLLAAGVGTAAGALAYAAGPWAAGLLGGLAGFAAALAVQARLWLRQAMQAVRPAA